ncbi:hypothetical protein ACVW1A_000036 [Bradyrhizobium sp. LB1.3]
MTMVGVPYKSAGEILAHPRFTQARLAHVDALAAVFVRSRIPNRLIVDAACVLTADLLVGFFAAHDRGDPTTWATVGRLQKLVAELGLASPRRMDDLIARFRQTGCVEMASSVVDKRIRILKPTERLLAHDRAYVAALYQPLDILFPDRGYEPLVRRDPHVHLAMRRIGSLEFPIVTAFIGRHPAIMMFLARDAGYCAFLLLMKAVLSGKQLVSDELSFTAIAERVGVSRTHIRNLFVEAAAEGHVSLTGAGGYVAKVHGRLFDTFDLFLADMASSYDAIGQMALAR